MIDLAKLQQALTTATAAGGLELNAVYVQFVINKGERQQSSQQRELTALLESKMSEAELAAEIAGQIGDVFKADEPAALKAEVADLREQLARAKSAKETR
jgi:HAMP domain-containing protein